MTGAHAAVVVAASFGAGVMNAMAGGGTILTFPALLLLGEPAITANATSTVALLPGSASSMAGYRDEVREHRAWLRTLLLPSVLGGAIGSVLLLRTPEQRFSRLAPWLVLFATALFVAQAALAWRRGLAPPAPRTRGRGVAAWLAHFAVSIYGGYFGAGVGILMLAVLGFMGLEDIHAMNGLKNFFGLCINGVAATWFVLHGAVDWPVAGLMAAGALCGGYAGARFARRIGRGPARVAVVLIGLGASAALLLRR